MTALQILQVTVLKSWGIEAQGVVGHSSGEIAAAYTAGFLTAEDAIKIAYFRGQVVSDYKCDPALKGGMLAVGLGYEQCKAYLEGKERCVQVGCFNSPESITLTGRTLDLEVVKKKLEEDGHFVRFLQIDMAYHSKFMADIGGRYEEILRDQYEIMQSSSEVAMFSSVTGTPVIGACDASYWRSNLVSPVQFEAATKEMLRAPGGFDFVLEIGPSDSLAGPLAQIKKSMNDPAINFTYARASKRGMNTANALLNVAGILYLAGHNVQMQEVNIDQRAMERPNVIVDLPNYSWNHSTKYWYESPASRDWRFKPFRAHDLLGSKVLGTAWRAPSWRKLLKVNDLPWLKDHKVGLRKRVSRAWIADRCE